MLDTDIRTDGKWKVGDIIRHKGSGHPYLVTGIRKYLCTYVVDLEDKNLPRPSLVFTKADYDNYAADKDMDERTMNDTIEWHYNPLTL